MRKLINLGYNTQLKVTDREVDALMDAYQDEVIAIGKVTTRTGRSNAAVGAAALAALIYGEPAEDVRKFFDVYNRGDAADCFGCNVSAAFNLSRLMMDAKLKGLTINARKTYNVTQNAIYLFLRGDGPVAFIRETKKDRYPVANKIKAALEGER